MGHVTSIALVTGAGTGVGKAITKSLLARGFAVALTGRRREILEETARALGGNTFVCPADISAAPDVATLFNAVVRCFGRLDLLVNNAGVSIPSIPIDELDVELWNQAVGTNLTGAFLCTREAFRQMKRQDPQGGRIINNGSVSATTPRPHSVPYTATKHAITGLTKSSALDGRPFNIACGQIDIGNAGTAMTREMARGVLQANGSLALEPTIDPELVGEAVANMAVLPLEANILTMTIMATKMPLVGRG
ncbi:MAG: 3-oxoacyl-ACP reductase [Devosia sp. 66-22]|nr:MAG: 3-oxoacyl-ACP reductase [Devosia sp. 66-22]